jgi:hypothetical protein
VVIVEWPGWWSGEAVAEVTAGSAGNLGWFVLAYLMLVVPFCLVLLHGAERARFWCPERRRDVEVDFEVRGLLGVRRAVGVKCCSAFDPPTAVDCDRRCLDPDLRRAWASGMPSTINLGG